MRKGKDNALSGRKVNGASGSSLLRIVATFIKGIETGIPSARGEEDTSMEDVGRVSLEKLDRGISNLVLFGRFFEITTLVQFIRLLS